MPSHPNPHPLPQPLALPEGRKAVGSLFIALRIVLRAPLPVWLWFRPFRLGGSTELACQVLRLVSVHAFSLLPWWRCLRLALTEIHRPSDGFIARLTWLLVGRACVSGGLIRTPLQGRALPPPAAPWHLRLLGVFFFRVEVFIISSNSRF